MTTPKEEQSIAEAILEAQKRAEEERPITLYDSTVQLAELYVRLKNMGVDKEHILDLIRIPMMFATLPDKPEQVTATLADIDAVDRSN